MIISLIFVSIYLIVYSYYMAVNIRPLRPQMLDTVKLVVIIFWILIILDFINILTVTVLVVNGTLSRTRGYELQLVVKLLIRRISQIIFFKVMFTLKRVEVQLNPQFKSVEECLKALLRLIKFERGYFIFSSISILNIGLVIFLFVDSEYTEHAQFIYETVVMSISPIFWIANTFFVCYFKSMGQAYIKYLDSELMKKECMIKTFIWTIGLL